MQQLSPQQERAIEMITAGMRETDVARELDVNRTTIWRWRTDDAAFQAALNARRFELWNASAEHLRSLVPAALEALEDELRGPRKLRAAAAVLQLAGFKASSTSSVEVRPAGPTTAAGVESRRREDEELADLLNPKLRW
jgi:Helix-turn-helix of insertion element transposase